VVDLRVDVPGSDGRRVRPMHFGHR